MSKTEVLDSTVESVLQLVRWFPQVDEIIIHKIPQVNLFEHDCQVTTSLIDIKRTHISTIRALLIISLQPLLSTHKLDYVKYSNFHNNIVISTTEK